MNVIGTALSSAVLAAVSVGAAASLEIYIPLGASGQVQIVDSASDRIVGAIEDLGNAHGLAITPDGRTLVAGSFAEEPVGAERTPPRPAGVSEAEHAKHHAMPSGDAKAQAVSSGTSYVSIVDTADRMVVRRVVVRRVAVRGAVHHVAISPDGKLAVTTHPGRGGITAIDLGRFAVVAEVPTGAAPNYAAFSPDGRTVYVSNTGDNSVSEVDVVTWSAARRIATGQGPEHVVLSADGGTLYTNNVADGTASAITLAQGRVTRTFAVGAAPHGIDLSDDGATLFATSKGENRLVAIDLASGGIHTAALGPAPYHLTAVRGTDVLYVSSRAENRIWVVDQQTLQARGELTIGGIGHQMALAAR